MNKVLSLDSLPLIERTGKSKLFLKHSKKEFLQSYLFSFEQL